MFRELFHINEDGEVVINPVVWEIEVFAAIRDKYKDLSLAVVEVSIVYFAADYRSEFSYKGDIKERVRKARIALYSHRKVKIDSVTERAVDFYVRNNDTIKIKLIKSVRKSLDKAITLIDTINLVELKDIKDLAEIIAKLPAMLESMTSLEDFVKKEQSMDKGAVGAGDKSIYEDL